MATNPNSETNQQPGTTGTLEPRSPRRRRRARLAIVGLAMLGLPGLVPFVTGAEAQGTFVSQCPGATYTVVRGDGWSLIASRLKVSMASLLTANRATTSTWLFPGNVLCVPTTAPATTAPATTAPVTNPSTTAPVTTAPVTTVPAAGVTIRQFPAQGLCWFGNTWGAPRSGGRTHEGVDIIARSGLNVYAVDDGTITRQYLAASSPLAGNGWRLTRADGTYFFYAHLSAFAPGLKIGSVVKAGQILGQIGMTGAAGSPHLHFEVHPGGGVAVDPTDIVRAVDGCKVTSVPLQPGQTPPTTTPVTTVPVTTTPVTTPVTTVPVTTVPTTTTPVNTVPPANVPAVAKAAGPALWNFIAPVTVYDSNGQRVTANAVHRVPVVGAVGVPVDASGVMVRVSASNAATTGVLNVYSCDLGVNGTSTMNLTPGRISSTVAFVRNSGANICAVSSTGAQVRLEVLATLSSTGVGLQAQTARRALDTRASGSLAAGTTRTLSPAALGAPLGSKAVTVTVTVLNPSAAGSLSVGPCGGTPWTQAYAAVPSQVFSSVVRTNDGGLCLTSTGKVDVVVDVTGVWGAANALTPVQPVRLYDSRATGAVSTATTAVRMPFASGMRRAQFSIAIVGGSTGGALYVWNCGEQRPAATVGYTPATTVTAVSVSLDVRNGSVCVASTGTLHAVLDVVAVG